MSSQNRITLYAGYMDIGYMVESDIWFQYASAGYLAIINFYQVYNQLWQDKSVDQISGMEYKRGRLI